MLQTIRLTTLIDAPVERCFLLSLSVDLYNRAVAGSGHPLLLGSASGLLRPGEPIAWSRRHLGLRREHTSVIDALRPYSYFRDVVVQGGFGSLEHEHHFAPLNDGTRLRDEIRFASRSGIFGKFTQPRFEKRLRAYLLGHNAILKQVAESDEWHRYLDGQPALELAPAKPVA